MDVRSLLDRLLPSLGYQLTDVELGDRGRHIRVFIEKPEGVDIDDCVKVSNHLSRVFAVENVDYDRLEVSSPGLDRPLRRRDDFTRFAGEQVQVRLRAPVGGRRNFVGILRGLEGDNLQIEVDGNIVSLEFQDLDRARLVPNV
ncbi:MAG: ribosome maturation factor RimP [Thermoanaerobaculia bacterium]|jgi:ribosome maturation factor RimP